MAVNKVVRSDGTTLMDITPTTATAGDVASGKVFFAVNGVQTTGTASGGITPTGTKQISITENGTTTEDVTNYASAQITVNVSGGGTPSATAHTIYFEFTDETNTTITAYWDDSFISSAITATEPTTYGQKTVTLAQLDGVTWYSYSPSVETWETIYNDTPSPNADTPYNYLWLSSLSDVYPTLGSVWRVTIDGTSWITTARQDQSVASGAVYIGNPKYSGGQDDGSGMTTDFYNAGWGAWVGDTEISAGQQHTVKIERQVTS